VEKDCLNKDAQRFNVQHAVKSLEDALVAENKA
jgi:hypothetical protein